MRRRFINMLAVFSLLAAQAAAEAENTEKTIDLLVVNGMEKTGSNGLALAIIEDGKVTYVNSWGKRNAVGDPLTADTVMYGASLTKMMFGYLVAQLADEGKIDLDASIATYLPKPLPEYVGE
jgi:CubicO group peptidase (beta-lactamase class C family)